MKAIVTGGAGFIGSHLVDLLLDEGHEVVVVDSLATGRLENLAHRQGAAGLSFARHDIREPGLESAFAGADWVFHLAALADIVPSVERPEAYFTTNVDGTFRVLEAARAAGVKRFVYAASSSCYGIPDAYPTPETAPPRPQYPYALTKWLGEQTVLHWGQVYRLPVVSLRLFNVYGPRARTGGTYGAVMGVFLAQKLAGKPFTIVGDGTQVRDFVFVQDIARAFLAAAASDVAGEVMNVGTGDPQSVNRLAELLGPAERVALPWRPGEPDRTHADAGKIARLLGWRPRTTFAEGVQRTLAEIHHWRDAPVWDAASIARATESWFKCLGGDPASGGPASACRGGGVRQANPKGRWPEAGPERAQQ